MFVKRLLCQGFSACRCGYCVKNPCLCLALKFIDASRHENANVNRTLEFGGELPPAGGGIKCQPEATRNGE